MNKLLMGFSAGLLVGILFAPAKDRKPVKKYF